MTEESAWIGQETSQHDIATAAPLRRFAALLDRADGEADILPPLAHWLYFLPEAMQSTLGVDGHPVLGDELPALGFPRRMWAGSRISFHAPMALGAAIERRPRKIGRASCRGKVCQY